MRYLKMFSLILMISILMGSGIREAKLTQGTKPGNLAPELKWQEDLLQSKHYVLLQFWAAYDPESRVNNLMMNRLLNELETDTIKMISISFDESKSVFEGTVKTDQLAGLVYNATSGKESALFKQYALKNGFSNVLIDPHGVIIARDITYQDIKAMRFN